jgi:hypothetical protein
MAQINLQKISSIKGHPGLFELMGCSTKGYYLQPFDGGSVRFLTNQKGKVLALGNVDLKLVEGTINALDVFLRMKDQPRLSINSGLDEINSFFRKLLPDLHDEVASSHLDKINKWYHLIVDHYQMTDMVNVKNEGLAII